MLLTYIGVNMSVTSLTKHSDTKKLEVVSLITNGYKIADVSELTGVPEATISKWKASPWWGKAVLTLHREDRNSKLAKISILTNKAIDIVGDRLTNGDYVFDQREGVERRIPVTARVALDATTKLLDLQVRIQTKEEDIEQVVDTNDKLNKLADAFSKFAKGKKIAPDSDIIDVEATEVT